jgi:hypothetical protein
VFGVLGFGFWFLRLLVLQKFACFFSQPMHHTHSLTHSLTSCCTVCIVVVHLFIRALHTALFPPFLPQSSPVVTRHRMEHRAAR